MGSINGFRNDCPLAQAGICSLEPVQGLYCAPASSCKMSIKAAWHDQEFSVIHLSGVCMRCNAFSLIEFILTLPQPTCTRPHIRKETQFQTLFRPSLLSLPPAKPGGEGTKHLALCPFPGASRPLAAGGGAPRSTAAGVAVGETAAISTGAVACTAKPSEWNLEMGMGQNSTGQVEVHVSIYRSGKPFWGYPIFEPQPNGNSGTRGASFQVGTVERKH